MDDRVRHAYVRDNLKKQDAGVMEKSVRAPKDSAIPILLYYTRILAILPLTRFPFPGSSSAQIF